MSCWVVPSIAAELWGVSVEHVLAGIREGRIASRVENGFVCVDAAPGSPRLMGKRDGEHPPTFTVVTEDEMAALLGGNADDELLDEESEWTDEEGEPGEAGEEGEPEEQGTLDWRDARRRNARLRRAPALVS